MRLHPALLLGILFLTGAPQFSPAENRPFEAEIRVHEKRLAEFRPRSEGSIGESRSVGYIARVLAERGIIYVVSDFSNLEGAHSFSRMVRASLPGERADTLYIAVGLNNDDPFGLALALALAGRLQGFRTRPSVELLFLGADADPRAQLGTRAFLQDFVPEHSAAFIYLDLAGRPERLRIETGGAGVVAPSWLLRGFAQALRRTEVPYRVIGNRNQVFRLGRPDASYPAEAYLKAGFPALTLRAEGAVPVGETAWEEGFARAFQDFLSGYGEGFPAAWDRHYLFFHAGGDFILLREYDLLVLLIVLLGGSLIYALVMDEYLRKYLRTFLRNFWNLPVLYGLCFVFLLAGTAGVDLVLRARAMPELWQAEPLQFFLLKLASSGFLLLFAFHFLRRLPFSKNGSFYSASSLVFLLLNVLVFTGINLSFSYYFLWAYLAALLFAVVKYRPIKLLMLLVAPFWLIQAALDIFSLPELRVARFLLTSPLEGNLFMAFMVLPFFLMLFRLDLIIRHPRRGKSGFGLKIALAGSSVLAAALAIQALGFEPYQDRPQPVSIREVRDAITGVDYLTLESPAPLGGLELNFGGSLFPLKTAGRSIRIEIPPRADLVRVDRSEETFLERRRLRILLRPFAPPEKYELRLVSGSAFVVHEANFPHSMDLDGRGCTVFTGRNPPVPMEYDLTLPDDSHPELILDVHFPMLSKPVMLSGRPVDIESSLSVRTKIQDADNG